MVQLSRLQIKGETIISRQPIEKDVVDYLKVEVSRELVRMYDGSTYNLFAKTRERAQQFVKSIMDKDQSGMSSMMADWAELSG